MSKADNPPTRSYVAPLWRLTDPPGIADVYAGISADVLAGYDRLRGRDATAVTLLFGDDSQTAMARVSAYRDLWGSLGLTCPDIVQAGSGPASTEEGPWRAWEEDGDLYRARYTGWHCAACERFYTDHEILDGPSCRTHLEPVTKVDTTCWFFRLSRYEGRLRAFYDRVEAESGRPFVQPGHRMSEVRARLAGGLADVPLYLPLHPANPGDTGQDPDPRRASAPLVALANTPTDLSAQATYVVPDELVDHWAILWPAMLMAGGRPLPAGVVATSSPGRDDGRGSAGWRRLRPHTAARDLGGEVFRYLLLRRPAGGEVTGDALVGCYASELAGGLGNLITRTTALAADPPFSGVIPAPDPMESPFAAAIDRYGSPDESDPEGLLHHVVSLVRAGNAFIEERKPWSQDISDRGPTLWYTLELCRLIGHLISPVLPDRSREILAQLGVAEQPHWAVWGGYRHEFRVPPPAPTLFPTIGGSRRKRLLSGWADEADQRMVRIEAEDFGRLELRVARVDRAEPILADGRTLLKLTLDVGGEHRVVFSTKLAQDLPPEALTGRMVVYLANLEPTEIAGFASQGMVLAALDGESASPLMFDLTHEPGTVLF